MLNVAEKMYTATDNPSILPIHSCGGNAAPSVALESYAVKRQSQVLFMDIIAFKHTYIYTYFCYCYVSSTECSVGQSRLYSEQLVLCTCSVQ